MPKDSPMFCGLPPDYHDIGTDTLFCLQCQSQQRFPQEFNSLYPICEQCDPLYVGLMRGTHFRRMKSVRFDDQERSEHIDLEEVYERSWVELPMPLVPLQAVRKSELVIHKKTAASSYSYKLE